MGTMGLALPGKASALQTGWRKVEALHGVPETLEAGLVGNEKGWNGTRIASASREAATGGKAAEISKLAAAGGTNEASIAAARTLTRASLSQQAGKWGTRVEGYEHVSGGPMRTSVEAAGEDAALAAACHSGDLHAYERLYTLHGAKMKNLARNVLGNAVDAEDAVQETFLKVQRSIATFRGQSSFVTWTYRILINTCYDARRSRLRKKEVTTDDDSEDAPRIEPRAPGAHPSLRMALERALGKLTRHQRDVFLLYEVEGFRHAEIAGMLEITEAASKNTLFQAKKNLREMLEPPRSSTADAR